MKLIAENMGKDGFRICIENGSILAYAPTLELAKQEAAKVLGDLQLELLTLEVNKE
jgi:hypothetical protein